MGLYDQLPILNAIDLSLGNSATLVSIRDNGREVAAYRSEQELADDLVRFHRAQAVAREIVVAEQGFVDTAELVTKLLEGLGVRRP
jgi:hypothetical protein